MVWEVRTTGASTNGGGFDPVSGTPGTDYSQQTSPQISYTDLVIGATTTQCTSAANPFTSADVGNIINITSGTGFTVQRVQILSVAAGVATCDKSLGTTASTGGHGNLGGCLATIQAVVAGLAVAGNTIWVKATATYTISSAISTANAGSSALPISLIGYNVTRGDNGQATILASSAVSNCLAITSNYWRIYNFVLDGNNQTTTGGIASAASYTIIANVEAIRFTKTGIQFQNNYGKAFNCVCTAGSSAATAAFSDSAGVQSDFDCCVASGNACPGFVSSDGTGSSYDFCISANNTGASSDGFQYAGGTNSTVRFKHCTAYNNGRDGIRFTAAAGPDGASVLNCILVNNAGYGINSTSTNWSVGPAAAQSYLLLMNYNAYYGNGTAAYNQLPAGANDVTLTGDPFVAGASNNFQLNGTLGAGAACLSAGFPGALQLGGSGAASIGTLQGGSSGAVVVAPTINMYETRYS